MATSGEILMVTHGEKRWLPVGNFVAASREKPIAIDSSSDAARGEPPSHHESECGDGRDGRMRLVLRRVAERCSHVARHEARAATNAGRGRVRARALVFATSEALGDIGSSDVAVLVPKYRVFMNAGHAPTTIRDRSRDPRIPRAGRGSSRGADQLCAASAPRRSLRASPLDPAQRIPPNPRKPGRTPLVVEQCPPATKRVSRKPIVVCALGSILTCARWR